MSEPFTELDEAINDQRFVDVDLALRRGQHIDHDDADWYAYLLDARGILEPFYRRYGCELIQRSDGYFFLLPTGEKVSKRLLGLPEMIVGQGAALLFLDPSTVESGGVITKDDLLSHLAAVMGTDALMGVFNPKRKRMDERVAQETVRQRIAEGLRKLSQLGFITLSEDNRIHLRSALMRFADPVRGAGSPRDALEKLIARGEVSVPSDTTPDDDAAPDGEPVALDADAAVEDHDEDLPFDDSDPFDDSEPLDDSEPSGDSDPFDDDVATTSDVDPLGPALDLPKPDVAGQRARPRGNPRQKRGVHSVQPEPYPSPIEHEDEEGHELFPPTFDHEDSEQKPVGPRNLEPETDLGAWADFDSDDE